MLGGCTTLYLRECLIENVGPIETVDLSLPFDSDGNPKPVILVGRDGSGKTVLLSHFVDALIEFAKTSYRDILIGQIATESPYFKILGGINQRSGTDYGIALLQFADTENTYCYVDKSGTLDSSSYQAAIEERFPSVSSWPTDQSHKAANISEDKARSFFRGSSVAYFPSARHERPHWLNREGLDNEGLFSSSERLSDRLYKPIIVESSASENKQWLLDIMLDSRAEIEPFVPNPGLSEPELDLRIISNKQNLWLLYQSRLMVESILKSVLQDNSARLQVNYRTVGQRLYIHTDSATIPSLDHLSSGQANLFNLFVTIIRYADIGDINKSFTLPDIEGIVLIDEIEAQAHSDLQHEVLPNLLKLFPKVQFILTSHSPLFLMGMENKYGGEGFQVVDMPSRQSITTERFSEFERSWQYYRSTARYEQDMEEALQTGLKPKVLTEGETDPKYIKIALELLDREDLTNALEIEWVGTQGQQGPLNTGQQGLNYVRNVLLANPDLTNRKVLLLYDCDTNKPDEDLGHVRVRSIPKNEDNSVAKKGIENLLPSELFESRFYRTRNTEGDYGEQKSIQEFDKMSFCQWVCDERKQASDFESFSSIAAMIDELINL